MRLLVAMLLLCSTANAQEAGVLVSGTFLKEIGVRDVGIGTSALVIGGRVVYQALPHVDLETDIIIWPNNPVMSGTWIQGLFGAKVGQRFERVGFFAKVRPGFMHFRKDPFGASAPGGSSLLGRHFVSSTERSIDIGGVFE